MRHFFLIIFSIFISISANAQRFPFYQYYEMDKVTTPIEREESDLLFYYNKFLLAAEYEYDELYGSFFKYHTEHYRVKLLTDVAIEEFNKVYIPMKDVASVKRVEARVIKPDETVKIEVEMEEQFSEDEDEQYFYFPITGLELGDELEILYVLKMEAAFSGDQFYFQGEVPVYDFDFRFISPNDSEFDFLAHNGLPEPKRVDTILQRHQWDIHLDTIPAFKEEYFTEYNNATMKLDAALKKVDYGVSDYSPYELFNQYAIYTFTTQTKGKDIKRIKELKKRLGISSSNKQVENVRLIENYMKTEFLIGYGAPGMSIAEMIETGRGDGTGALKLFMVLLDDSQIPFEYGLVSDRYDTYFSPDIESDYFLQNYFFYFPEINQYLAPLDFASRLGYIDYQWVPNNGLFLKRTAHQGNSKTSDFDVRKIPSTKAQDNQDSVVIYIDVAEGMEDAEIRVKHYLTGYDAGEYQVYYYLYSEEKRKECHDELLNFFKDNSQFKMTDIKNVEPEDAFLKPLIIEGKITALYTPIFEKAGDKTIFKLGNIFGEYINPLELEKKKSDFVFGHPFMSSTTIVVNFPHNVKVSNGQTIPQFDRLVSLDETWVQSQLTIKPKQIVYTQRDVFHLQHYSIEQKDELMKIFRFYSDLSKMNLIVE